MHFGLSSMTPARGNLVTPRAGSSEADEEVPHGAEQVHEHAERAVIRQLSERLGDPSIQPIEEAYPEIVRDYQPLLVEMLVDTARWREAKANRFPDDRRNARCAAALAAAAEYVAGLPTTTRGCLHIAVEGMGWSSLPPREMLYEQSEVAARFCFDNSSVPPGKRDFDHLLDEMYVEQLEQWREGIEGQNTSRPDRSSSSSRTRASRSGRRTTARTDPSTR